MDNTKKILLNTNDIACIGVAPNTCSYDEDNMPIEIEGYVVSAIVKRRDAFNDPDSDYEDSKYGSQHDYRFTGDSHLVVHEFVISNVFETYSEAEANMIHVIMPKINSNKFIVVNAEVN